MIIAVDQNPQLVAFQRGGAGGIPRFPQKIVKVSAPVGCGPISQLNIMPTVSVATSVGVMTPPGGSLMQQTMTLQVSNLPLWCQASVFHVFLCIIFQCLTFCILYPITILIDLSLVMHSSGMSLQCHRKTCQGFVRLTRRPTSPLIFFPVYVELTSGCLTSLSLT